MSERFWTRQPPTENGYYWHREDISRYGVIRYIQHGKVYFGGHFVGDAEGYGGEWWGPIEEPGGGAIEDCRSRNHEKA